MGAQVTYSSSRISKSQSDKAGGGDSHCRRLLLSPLLLVIWLGEAYAGPIPRIRHLTKSGSSTGGKTAIVLEGVRAQWQREHWRTD